MVLPGIQPNDHVIAVLCTGFLTTVPTASTQIPSWCLTGDITDFSELTFFAPAVTSVPGFAHKLTADKDHLAFLAHLPYLF